MRKLKKYKPTKFKAKTSTYNKELADYAVAFIESLCHTKGTWAGHPFELIDWQEQIIRDLFGTVKPNGYRQFNTAYIEIPKKQGKQLALLIKLDSPGPIIFAHQRIGKDGKLFPCLKFRTMCMDADQRLKKYLEDNPEARKEWEAEFKLKEDPRVTRVGRVLRKTSLDELPQLFNVLIGQMSLVGPRPIVTAEIPKYGPYIKDFYMVHPGITGMWQVNGRSDTTYDERVQMDSWYVRNWGVWLDIMLLWRTFGVVLQHKGAY